MYRSLLAMLLFAIATCSIDSVGFAQDDPFGAGPNQDDPFGGGPERRKRNPNQDDPFVNPPAAPQLGQNRTTHRFAAVLAKAKAAIAKGHQSTDVRGFDLTVLERKVNAALEDETAIEAVDAPLNDICLLISQTHNIPVLVNQRALEEIGLTADTPVTIKLKGVKLRTALRLMLSQLDLTYLVADEVLQITTIEAAEQNLRVEMFKLPKQLVANKQDVIQAITSNVAPATWESLGGPSTIMFVDDVLIVSTSDDVLHNIGKFINQLSRVIEK